MVFSPDGKRLVSGSVDETVKIWDVASGQETLTLNEHKNKVCSVAFSPDGKQLVSGSLDNTVKLWDARPWTPELRVEQEARNVVQFLSDKKKPQVEWKDAIMTDQTISEPVRDRALEFAADWKNH